MNKKHGNMFRQLKCIWIERTWAVQTGTTWPEMFCCREEGTDLLGSLERTDG